MDSKKILNTDYLDIIFDGRNKKYGGYELRKKYPRRARNAALITLLVAILIVAGPAIADRLRPAPPPPPKASLEEVVLAAPPPVDETKPEPPPPPAAPPPPVKPTVQFTPPVIEPDELVKPTEVLVENKKLEDVAVGPTTQVGDPNGIDPGLVTNPGTGTGNAPVTSTPKTDEILTVVDQQAVFPGDVNSWLARNLVYPDIDREMGNQGRVIVQFVVNLDGSVTNVKVVRSSKYEGLDKEAVNRVSRMPKWTPAKNNNQPVRSYFSLPITFRLD